ncbi:LysR family transcriptional regulator [uncultured Paracoccus sp.]|uniref:LysR family transcriptional regulator n=1 Tax=uncultured Paracoccus sp. TaxID=189685 RepID=UPI0026188F78|nr:LysR family transcriptional regulator [uncultured Paracoccus sp.]
MREGAGRQGTTQPGLSRTVAYLEPRLKEPLFLRGRRPLEPTPLGRDLAEQGGAIRHAVERAQNAVDAFTRDERGTVRIGGTPFFMDALISGMIGEFQRRRPNVRIAQSYDYTGELATKIRAGQLDMAACPIKVFDAESDLGFEEILPGRNVIACRAGHPLLLAAQFRAADVLNYSWIEPPPGSPLSADLQTALIGLGADRVRIIYSWASLAGILAHLRTSNSLAVLPFGVIHAERRFGDICWASSRCLRAGWRVVADAAASQI